MRWEGNQFEDEGDVEQTSLIFQCWTSSLQNVWKLKFCSNVVDTGSSVCRNKFEAAHVHLPIQEKGEGRCFSPFPFPFLAPTVSNLPQPTSTTMIIIFTSHEHCREATHHIMLPTVLRFVAADFWWAGRRFTEPPLLRIYLRLFLTGGHVSSWWLLLRPWCSCQ